MALSSLSLCVAQSFTLLFLIWMSLCRPVILGKEHRQDGVLHHFHSPGAKHCDHNHDCDVTLGQNCMRLYEGCNNGQCMCNPWRQKRHTSGHCIDVHFGNEGCSTSDMCVDGMTCQHNVCGCSSGTMTPDALFCQHANEKLLGEVCRPGDTCLQRAAYGYVANNVRCSKTAGVCECGTGYKEDHLKCRPMRVHEHGCTMYYHCQGGAICVDRRCVCPHGYIVSAHRMRCIKRGATTDLPLGAECDELNELSYCAQGLICRTCGYDPVSHCVRSVSRVIDTPFPSAVINLSSRQNVPTIGYTMCVVLVSFILLH